MVSKEKLKNPVFLFNAFLLAAFIILNSISNGYAEVARRFPKFVLGIGIVVLFFWMVIYFVFPINGFINQTRTSRPPRLRMAVFEPSPNGLFGSSRPCCLQW